MEFMKKSDPWKENRLLQKALMWLYDANDDECVDVRHWLGSLARELRMWDGKDARLVLKARMMFK